jgi:hypothetical protein
MRLVLLLSHVMLSLPLLRVMLLPGCVLLPGLGFLLLPGCVLLMLLLGCVLLLPGCVLLMLLLSRLLSHVVLFLSLLVLLLV